MERNFLTIDILKPVSWKSYYFLPPSFLSYHLSLWFIDFLLSYFLLLCGGGGGFVTKSCPTLVTTWIISSQVSSVSGISQARILEWVAISFAKGSSWPKNETYVSCIASEFFTTEPTESPLFPFMYIL